MPQTPKLLPDIPHALKVMQKLHLRARARHQRLGLCLHGDDNWLDVIGSALQQNLSAQLRTLHVADPQKHASAISAKHLIHHLGQEVDIVLWDGRHSLDANAINACIGLIRGGGLLILAMPALSIDQAHSPDFRYQRYFRMSLTQDPAWSHIEQGKVALETNEQTVYATTPLTPLPFPSREQDLAIAAIEQTYRAHGHRPLLIQAHRGRGKSTAMALAACGLLQRHESLNIIITAPAKSCTHILFKHLNAQLPRPLVKRVQFFAPDTLLIEQPPCALLMVDEAAAIPAPVLVRLVKQYARIVMATTVHGYEGTGRGFELRFKKQLDQLAPGWKTINLQQPTRWQEGDPLEQWSFKTFSLDAALPQCDVVLANAAGQQKANLACRWLNKDALLNNVQLMRNLMALMTLAHYQTRPSDLQLVLEHPDLRVALVEGGQSGEDHVVSPLVGLAIIMEEGQVADASLRLAVVKGQRRPPGHLVPQALAMHACEPEILTLKSWRIMRIVVLPSLSRQGIGSMLLNYITQEAEQKQVQLLCTSYGLTEELWHFWQQNGYRLAWLGYHRDQASGLHSAIMTRALDARADAFMQDTAQQFSELFLATLAETFTHLEQTLVELILAQLDAQPQRTQSHRSPQERDLSKAKHFAFAARSLADSQVALLRIYNGLVDQPNKLLSPKERQLIVEKLVLKRPWSALSADLAISGKKQGLARLREAFQHLLEAK